MTILDAQTIWMSPGELPAAWHGAEQWEREGGRWQPWRLPPSHPGLVHAPGLASMARMPAGMRAVVRTDAAEIWMRLYADRDETTVVDVLADGELLARHAMRGGQNVLSTALPPGTKTVEVWLPTFGEVAVGECALISASLAEPVTSDGLRWVAYGSSITQCRRASGPSESWPALVARQHGWQLRCLGFGGQCHLDPVTADAIVRAPADLVSMCLGINIQGPGTFSERTLAPQVSGFVQQVRAAHPGTPIVVMSPIVAPDREEQPNAVGMTLQDVRREIEHAVRVLQQLGDTLLFGIHGPDVFGHEHVHLLDPDDRLHPTAAGDRQIAAHLTPRLHAILTSAIAAGSTTLS